MKNIILLKNPSIPQDPYQIKFSTEYNARFIPLLTHTHKDKSNTISYLTNDEFINNIPIFIITSQRAVEMFNECIEEIDFEIRKKIYLKSGYTVGPATFNILKNSGFKDVRGGEKAGNGSKLADLIINEVDINTPIVFFTGEIRKDIIPKKLINFGYNLKEFIIYKTQNREDIVENFNQVKLLNQGWIVFFSPQGTKEIVEHLRSCDGNNNTNWKIASIGPTTEEYLLEYDIKPHVIATKPEPESLFQCIYKYDNK